MGAAQALPLPTSTRARRDCALEGGRRFHLLSFPPPPLPSPTPTPRVDCWSLNSGARCRFRRPRARSQNDPRPLVAFGNHGARRFGFSLPLPPPTPPSAPSRPKKRRRGPADASRQASPLQLGVGMRSSRTLPACLKAKARVPRSTAHLRPPCWDEREKAKGPDAPVT